MLYPTELSSGGRTGFEPAANGLRRRSTLELSPASATTARDPRHTPRQRRAHRAGHALQGHAACAAVDHSKLLRIDGCSQPSIPARVFRSRPVPGIRARRKASHHRRSLLRASSAGAAHSMRTPPVHTGDAVAIDAAQATTPIHPDAGKTSENTRKNKNSVCGRTNEKPPVFVRGRSRSSEIGATDLRFRKDQSMWWRPRNSRPASSAHGPASRLRYVGRGSAMWRRSAFTGSNPEV